MSRVDDIRGRVKAATSGPWFRFIDDAYEDGPAHVVYTAPGDTVALTGHGPRDGSASRDAALIANAPADLAFLLERNAVLEAQLDTVRELADKWTKFGHSEVSNEREEGWTHAARQVARQLRAALNQGGETNGG